MKLLASFLFLALGSLMRRTRFLRGTTARPKQAIVDFVAKVTKEGSPDFVPPAERIATFDNDGTLWCEQPMYFQLLFALDRVKALAPQHPEWKDEGAVRLAAQGRCERRARGRRTRDARNHHGHARRHDDRRIRARSSRTGSRPRSIRRFKRPYTECVYQPMLELLAYLRANGFKTFIVSGGGIEFMRPWTEKVYGIPPEQVVGSSIKTKFEMRDGKPVLVRLPEINFIDDKAGKPVGINSHIGRRPIAAFGNSDGDLQMLEWTPAGSGPRFCCSCITTTPSANSPTARESKIGTFSTTRSMAEAKEKAGPSSA